MGASLFPAVDCDVVGSRGVSENQRIFSLPGQVNEFSGLKKSRGKSWGKPIVDGSLFDDLKIDPLACGRILAIC